MSLLQARFRLDRITTAYYDCQYKDNSYQAQSFQEDDHDNTILDAPKRQNFSLYPEMIIELMR